MGQPNEHAPAFHQSDDAQKDLLAMLAAGRELGPEMDKSLVESYVSRQQLSGPPAMQAQTPQPPAIAHAGLGIGNAVGLLAVLGIYVAALAFTDGTTWWLIFPLMPFLFASLRHSGYSEARYQRRAQRDRMRYELKSQALNMHYGMLPPRNVQTPMPTSNAAPMPQPVPAPQLPSAESASPTVPAAQARPVAESHSHATASVQPPHNPAG